MFEHAHEVTEQALAAGYRAGRAAIESLARTDWASRDRKATEEEKAARDKRKALERKEWEKAHAPRMYARVALAVPRSKMFTLYGPSGQLLQQLTRLHKVKVTNPKIDKALGKARTGIDW
eukprot:gene16802-22717_t